MNPTKKNRDEWWSPSDLFFLKDALERGMAFTEVAGFLCRDEDEVRKKAKQLKYPVGAIIAGYDEESEYVASQLSRCYTCSRGPGTATCARPL
jgi:hypothetical protein